MKFTYKKASSILIGVVAATLTIAANAQEQSNREEPGFGDDPRVSTGPIAPILEGLGTHKMEVTTHFGKARKFFNQGLTLAYAFNHAEAKRSFQEAIRLDPEFAMAYWGWALVMGPNINRPMPADEVAEANGAMQRAVALKGEVSEIERGLIEALDKRYSEDPDDRAQLDAAYSKAMKSLYDRYPDDPDVGTLYAASVMNLMPWSYWTKDRRPQPRTVEAMTVLERVFRAKPDHAGAHHYYIHIVEEHFPEKAKLSADQLIKLVPGAGHLMHMPSHIYMRLGRYADAYESNRLAVLADEDYLTACRQQGVYPLGYYPHNIHFMTWSAQREGRSAEALKNAQKVGRKAMESAELGADFALHQTFMSQPLYALIRFGMWDEILRQPTPDKDLIIARGISHMGNGLAYLHKGRTDKARNELDFLQRAIESDMAGEEFVGFANGRTVLRIAEGILAGEIAAKSGDLDEALAQVAKAVRLEDALMYNEPPDWPFPVRHTLGALLLEADRADEAEGVYWEDLKRNPENGYALFGLHQALTAQEKTGPADEIWKRFEEAWAKADFELTTSRY